MASELLKNKALIQRLKEPDVPVINFDLANSALDYNIESIEEDILPKEKPQELFDERDRLRIESLEQSLQESKPFLMDESVDFIEREEKAIGGGLIEGTDLGTREGFQELFTRKGFSLAKAKRYEANKQKWMKANNATEEDFNKLGKNTKARIRSTGNIYLASDLENPKDFNVKRRDKNRKKAVDIIVKDMEEFYKTALPGEKYILPKNLRVIVNVNNKKVKIPGNEETLEKYLINDLKKATDLEFERAGDPGVKNVPRGTTSLTKEQRDYYRKNYNKKSMSDIVRHFIGEGVGTSNLKYVNLYEKFKRFRRDLLNFKAIKEKDIVKVDPKKYSSDKVAKRVAQDLRNKILADLGVSGQENKLNRIQREIAEELYKPSAFIKDKLDRTYVPFDLAHRAGYAQFNKLGANYSISTLGPDLPEANRELVSVIENKLKPLYEEQVKLFNKANKNLTKELSKKIDTNNNKIAELIASEVETDPKIKGRILGVQVDPYNLKVGTTPIDYTKSVDLGILDVAKIGTTGLDSRVKADIIARNYKELIKNIGQEQGFLKKKFKIPTAEDSKNIAKKLASFGFKCSASEGGACDNPMNYLEDIKKQQALAKGSGNVAASAAKKLSAGKAIFREVLGPAALGFELAAAVPITYLGYKAGLPPARIVADATYGLFGDTEKARLKKVAVKEGVDTKIIDRILNFREKSGALQTLAMQEGDFRGPDDEMLFPQQFEKGEEDFYKAVDTFRDEEGEISGDIFKKEKALTEKIENIIAEQNAALAAEREAKTDLRGIGDYLTTGVIPEEQPILPVFDFQEESTRMDFSEGGPNNPSRRTFLKFMAGIASLPFVGKFFKTLKGPKVVKLSNTTTTMPDWFPAFVDKAFEKGVAKKVDADITEVDIPELPNVKVRRYDDGRVEVEGKNGYGEPYEIDYTPPGYELVDETTGKAVKTPGEFQANDTVYRRVGPEGDDFDVDFEVVDDVEQILGGDSTKLEGFAKGTGESKYTRGQRNIDEAEAIQERADVFEGPDIDIDYED